MSIALVRACVLLQCLALVACGRSPLPSTASYDGVALTKATSWSRGGLSGVVFVTPGQALPDADVQLGVMHSTAHTTGEALLAFATAQFRQSDVLEQNVIDAVDESCKGGLNNTEKPRVFITLQVCRTGVGAAACAELDERFPFEDVACLHQSPRCFETMCNARWEKARAILEPIVKRALTLKSGDAREAGQ